MYGAPPPRGSQKLSKLLASASSKSSHEAKRKHAFQVAWIVYHLSAALAARQSRRSRASSTFARDGFRKMMLDIHNFVVKACEACAVHHEDYMRTHPVGQDFEKWVYELHNAVNRRVGHPEEEDFATVQKHYQNQLDAIGGDRVTMATLSRALIAINGRFCYECAP